MKILIVNNLYPPHYVGGYELHCQTVARELRARGHEILVLTSDHQVENIPFLPEPGIQRQLKLHGALGHPWLPIHRLKNLEQHNQFILRETLNEYQPDLVYCWNFSGLSKSLLFTLQEMNLPVVFCVCDHWVARSPEADVWLNWWNRKNISLAHRCARKILRRHWRALPPINPVQQLKWRRIYFCSRALRDFTAAAGFDVARGGVIYCPVDTERFSAPPKPERTPVRRLLFVGRLTADKGVMTALRAMALVRDKFEGQLTIVGRGEADYESQLRSFVQSEKLPVTFAGATPPGEMPSVYAAHDALLFTSEWAEPFALTPLEAMASGLPVIATTTGGSVELFRHGENALTYAAGDCSELAWRILELDRNAAWRARIAAAGQDEVRARYAESSVLDQVETYLQESLEDWRPTPQLCHV